MQYLDCMQTVAEAGARLYTNLLLQSVCLSKQVMCEAGLSSAKSIFAEQHVQADLSRKMSADYVLCDVNQVLQYLVLITSGQQADEAVSVLPDSA